MSHFHAVVLWRHGKAVNDNWPTSHRRHWISGKQWCLTTHLELLLMQTSQLLLSYFLMPNWSFPIIVNHIAYHNIFRNNHSRISFFFVTFCLCWWHFHSGCTINNSSDLNSCIKCRVFDSFCSCSCGIPVWDCVYTNT